MTTRKEQASLRPYWCDCPDGHTYEGAIYFPNNSCPCGIDKHHYHCPTCLGVAQLG